MDKHSNVQVVSAAEMNSVSLESQQVRKLLFKCISESAKANRCFIEWSFIECAKKVVDDIIEELLELGYTLKRYDEHILIIWGEPFDDSRFESYYNL